MADFVDPLLKLANSPVLTQFLHDCVDDLTGTKAASFDNYNSDIEWTAADFTVARRHIQKVYRQSVIDNNFDSAATSLGENVRREIQTCLDIRRDDIFQALVKEKLVNSGHNLVENIDWRVKWVLGNSKLASVREPLLQLDLNCMKSDNKSTVNCEMDLQTLDALIEQLEKVMKQLETA